ncbi:MAG: acyl-CoA thioesterase [Gammaproteobacteria bacterium]|nr:acyl-CoA thioesterase [Gammaproteobacteria bacterium]
MHEAEVEIIIPFHDVDMMAISWHGHYVKYFELARCALFDKIDYNYEQMRDSGYAWPVIDLRIRYPGPTTFNQKVIVKAVIIEWENRLKIDYELRDSQTEKRLTKGYTVQVAVDMSSQEMCFESPPILYEKLGLEP